MLKVNITPIMVEEVLNHKVNKTVFTSWSSIAEMEDVLNCKVNTTQLFFNENHITVEEILNHKVNTTIANLSPMTDLLEKVLTTGEILKVTN